MFNTKKILAASMLVSLTAPIFFLIAFFIQQQHIRHEMKEKLEYGSLQTIAIKKSEFEWFKKDKEIIIEGQLFDVKSIVINKNEIIVTGLFDADEDELEKVFSSVIHQENNETAPINKLILKFLLSPAWIRNYEAVITWSTGKPVPLFRIYDEALSNQSYAIKTPPPII